MKLPATASPNLRAHSFTACMVAPSIGSANRPGFMEKPVVNISGKTTKSLFPAAFATSPSKWQRLSCRLSQNREDCMTLILKSSFM